MRAIAITTALIGMFMSGAALAENPDWQVRCGGPFQLCGYVERGTSAPRLPLRYEAAKPFRNGLAAVRIEGRWGYIDARGDLVIQPAYSDAAPFQGDFTEVRVNGAAGVIDRAGQMVLAPRFARVIPFAGDLFIAVPLGAPEHTWSWADADPLSLNGFGGAGLYDLRRGWLTDTDFQFTTFDAPDRGLIWAGRGEPYREVWGLMRADGTWQVDPRYGYVQKLTGARANVRTLPDDTLPPEQRHQSVHSGAVDEAGRLIVPLESRWLGSWRGRYAAAGRNGAAPGVRESNGEPEAGVVTLDGTLLGGRYFDEVSLPEDGSLPRARLGGVWYSLGDGGELLPDQLDGTPLLDCPDGRSLIHRGSRVEVRRRDGGMVGLFGQGHFSSSDCRAAFSLQRDGRLFVLTPEGDILGGDQGFENLYDFNGETAAVRRDGKWGVIDRRGEFTLPPRFDELRPVGPGVYVVGHGDDAQWIDAAGRPASSPQPLRPDPAMALACQGGLIRFQTNGRWGMRDEEGNTVVRPVHRVLTCFDHGSAWAVADDEKAWCPIGPDGDRRRAFACVQEIYPYVVTHHVPERFDEDPFESSVLWNLALLDHLSGARAEAPGWVPDSSGMGSHTVMGGLAIPERIDAATDPQTSGDVATSAARSRN